MSDIRYVQTKEGLEVRFSRKQWVEQIRRTLKQLDKIWPIGIEVGFYRSAFCFDIEIAEDIHERKAIESICQVQRRMRELSSLPRKNLCLYRKAQKMSQDKLAEISGISRGQICKLERGRRKISFKQAQILSIVLNRPIDDFLEGPIYEKCSPRSRP